MVKRILITGKNSYVGTKFLEYVSQWPDEYQVDAISVRDDDWKHHDFSGYDSVLHVAGIAHIKETKENRELYYKVNRDLAFEIAKKSKEAGIPHFIFLSSMSIFGIESGVIYKNTVPIPKSAYGKSKYEAEMLIKELEDGQFKVAIVRPPMIYGPNCPGNYMKLSKLAKFTPVFPKIENQRSMIFVDNLSNFLVQIILLDKEGNFHPQNKEYVNTSKIVEYICCVNEKKVLTTKVANPFLKLFLRYGIIEKVFSSLTYDITKEELDIINGEEIEFKETIRISENKL